MSDACIGRKYIETVHSASKMHALRRNLLLNLLFIIFHHVMSKYFTSCLPMPTALFITVAGHTSNRLYKSGRPVKGVCHIFYDLPKKTDCCTCADMITKLPLSYSYHKV
jgi:hypothetical protein